MKILRLRFKNLNSLAGVWDIDFTHPDYVSSGIFAIIGPTGAGKSTILDAICLGLYGQTPRLARITQSENEIMSRQTGECFAEVEFETAKGHYRCHWSQHRSRKQAGGQLQSPRHEIAEAESGMILESKLRAVVDKVEDVTGMDFDRFTRSMLLAQGSFAAFLQARPDERAPILEQITGTTIYSRISIKVHERTSEERKRVGEMRSELDGINLLSPPEVEALLRERSDFQLAERALTADVRILREAEQWRERIATLEGELLQLELDRHAFETRKASALPELELLEQAGHALKRGGDYAHICALRTQEERDRSELAVATESHPRLQLGWQSAFEALERAEAALKSVGDRQREEAELIRTTRELDVKLGEARIQLQGLAADIEKTARRNGDYRTEIEKCDHRLSETGDELQRIAAFLETHKSEAGLAEALTGIEQQLKSLKALYIRQHDVQAGLARQSERIKNATHSCNIAESEWQGAHHAVTEAENKLAEICTERYSLLQGQTLSALRSEAETVAARLNRLGAIQESVARIEETAPKRVELQRLKETLELKRHAIIHQHEALSGESELREQVVCRLQDNVLLLNRVRTLEEDRKQLVDGTPCPLCGSCDHPYTTGTIPHLDETRQELELALDGAKKVREQLSALTLELVLVERDQLQAVQVQQELRERQERDELFCTGAFPEIGVTADAASWPEIVLLESDASRRELSERHGIIRSVEQKELEERNAQAALAKLRDECAERDRTLLAARLGHENALSERTRLEEESGMLRADYERALIEVERTVAAYGCRDIDPDRADELLAVLTERRTAYAQRVQTGERLEKERTDAVAEREKCQALLAESEKVLVEKEQHLRERNSQRDMLIEQRLERYGERNPDTEEKLLNDLFRQAGELREAAAQEQHSLRAGVDGVLRQIERLTLSIAQRGGQRAELESVFSRHLIEAGFADEAAFVRACLPQEKYDSLVCMAELLRSDETALQTRYLDRTETLVAELDKELTDKPLELIREEIGTVSGRLSELQKASGAVEQSLRQHAEQQQRLQGRLQLFELQKKECERWERLHSLIGSGDGKKFRNFAQGLTFELMVAHANRQLQKMSDRYILVRDNSEPLELNVIDNYQAGEVRTTKNLSGGESFIASLALSLGLSGMTSRNVRVDSLFLDEGFGTLDEDALETALETLSGLQQDGKLIGIISHVPALKERIGTQIQLEAGSAGRSTLSGPGCRQIYGD